MFEEVTFKRPLMWECKQCHKHISDSETVAYHFLNGVLYGWCTTCFASSHSMNVCRTDENK
jgi:hypothetical protein